MTASYSRLDEEEADAIAVSITRRAGYDSLRGADFFSRMKREGDNAEQAAKENLQKMKQGFLQSQANCQKSVQVFNSSIFNQTSENAAKVNAICQDAENRRIQYNQQVVQVNRIAEQKASVTLYGDHPQDQNRIAAIAALNDYLEGRRELSTLDRYQQSYRVMVALREVDSVLLKVHQKAEIRPALVADGQPKEPSSLTLSEQLMDLKRAKDQGFISDSEYEQKRKQILNRY